MSRASSTDALDGGQLPLKCPWRRVQHIFAYSVERLATKFMEGPAKHRRELGTLAYKLVPEGLSTNFGWGDFLTPEWRGFLL